MTTFPDNTVGATPLFSPLEAPAWTWGFDCEGAALPALLSANVRPGAVWPYISGSGRIPWTTGQLLHFKAQGIPIYRVNQGYGRDASLPLHGDEFDFEAGAWDLPALTGVIAARRKVGWSTRVYCTWSNYAVVKQALAEAGTGRSTWYRIADWNLDQHLAEEALHADVYAGQWASAASNPLTLVPGTPLTLEQAQADLSVVLRMGTGWEG